MLYKDIKIFFLNKSFWFVTVILYQGVTRPKKHGSLRKSTFEQSYKSSSIILCLSHVSIYVTRSYPEFDFSWHFNVYEDCLVEKMIRNYFKYFFSDYDGLLHLIYLSKWRGREKQRELFGCSIWATNKSISKLRNIFTFQQEIYI